MDNNPTRTRTQTGTRPLNGSQKPLRCAPSPFLPKTKNPHTDARPHSRPQNFITFMDALKLKLRAKDQLHPLLTELMQSYARFSRSNDWAGRPKILNWLIELNQLKGASDEISDEQARQVRAHGGSFFQELFLFSRKRSLWVLMRCLDPCPARAHSCQQQMLFDIEHAYAE